MDIIELLKIATVKKASDIHISVGIAPTLRIDGKVIRLEQAELTEEDTEKMVFELLSNRDLKILEENGEVDSSYTISKNRRFRINAYKQKGYYGIALRIIPLEVPTISSLVLPKIVEEISNLPRGLILVTGPAGSGKSTTLAAMINEINKNRESHILTLEDPIEYLHKHKKSIVNQREIGRDSKTFGSALRASLRQDPDVILIGEMRDLESISIALTAAETGHLVLSTLHTVGSAKTIDRIIDVFPSHQQQQVRIQLSSVIQAVISQQLLPKADGFGRVAAFEIMIATLGIRNLIRDKKTYQIDSAIEIGAHLKMKTMDNALIELCRQGLISKEVALMQSINQDNIKKYII